jgi:hypothetical protein
MWPFRQTTTQGRLWWVVLALFATPLQADQDPPTTKDYVSANGAYVFRVIPNWGKMPPQLGTCRGQLYLRANSELKLQWERPLINDIAPACAFVADSGKYVVTVCEWVDEQNLDLPVVIYGHHGSLVNVWGRLDQIDSSLRGFHSTENGFAWLHGSLFLFGPDDATFIIRTGVGHIFVFRTERGELIDDRWKELRGSFPDNIKLYDQLQANAKKLVLHEAIILKQSDNPRSRKLGELILSQHTDAESAEILGEVMRATEGKRNTPRDQNQEQ